MQHVIVNLVPLRLTEEEEEEEEKRIPVYIERKNKQINMIRWYVIQQCIRILLYASINLHECKTVASVAPIRRLRKFFLLLLLLRL
jgi:hypothetical protein